MRISLCLLELRIQSAGFAPASHRYCTQVVAPVLQAMRAEPRYRFSLAACGSDLEFLAVNYPATLDLLRALVAREQAELIAPLYAALDWRAFPSRDLIKAAELGEATLHRLGLPAGRVLYLRAGAPGPALSRLVAGRFDWVVHRAEPGLARSGRAAPESEPPNHVRVVAGAGHLPHAAAAAIGDEARFVGLFLRNRLEQSVHSVTSFAADQRECAGSGIAIRWLHCGGAHHLVTGAPPQDQDHLFGDPAWLRMSRGVLDLAAAEGFAPTHIREIPEKAAELLWVPAPPAWAAAEAWTTSARADVLAAGWRARAALRASELALGADTGDSEPRDGPGVFGLEWGSQLLAETEEAGFGSPGGGNEHAEDVMRAAADLGSSACSGCDQRGGWEAESEALALGVDAPIEAEFLGAEGVAEWRRRPDGNWLFEARFQAEEAVCGVRFLLRGTGPLRLCCGEGEGDTWRAQDKYFESDGVTLHLPSGLTSFGDRYHLICDKCLVAVPARIVPGERQGEAWVTFAVTGSPEGRWREWRFLFAEGPRADALQLANRLNLI